MALHGTSPWRSTGSPVAVVRVKLGGSPGEAESAVAHEDGAALLEAHDNAIRDGKVPEPLPYPCPHPRLLFVRRSLRKPEEIPLTGDAPVVVSELCVLRLLAWIEGW